MLRNETRKRLVITIASPIETAHFRKYFGNISQELPKGMRGFAVNHLILGLFGKSHKISIYTLTPEITESVVVDGGNLKIYYGLYCKKARYRIADLFFKKVFYISQFAKNDEPDIIHAHWAYEFAYGAIKSGYKVIPFLGHLANRKSQSEVFNIMYKTAKEFLPDFILWLHTTKLKISKTDLTKLNQSLTGIIMAHWDGKVYQSPYKKFPSNVILLCWASHVVFCQDRGAVTSKLEKAGCKNIRNISAATSTQRFKESLPSKEIEYDIEMIGKKNIRKNPFLTMPGTHLRTKLIKKFYKGLRERFEVYGLGWKGKYAKGILPLSEQAKAYQKARLVLANKNLRAEYYFSNCLSIALSSGVPVLYHREKEVEKIFPEGTPFRFTDPEDALKKAKSLLKKSQTELDAIGKKARKWVINNMSTNNTFSYMIKAIKELHGKSSERISNPWLHFKNL